MNCPSRTDPETLTNPQWNQSPPPLNPDTTTRQDLNGISNAREHKDGAGMLGSSLSYLDDPRHISHRDGDPANYAQRAKGASLAPSGPPIALKNNAEAVGSGHLRGDASDSRFLKLKNIGLWLLSVIFVASVLSRESLWRYLHTPVQVYSMTSKFPRSQHSTVLPRQEPEAIPDTTRNAHKRDSCASGGVQGAEYDTPLHVAALFIILGTSTLACAFPVLATSFPRLRIPPSFLFVVSHFGTGVLIATAFVHLLPTAFTSLGNPCLPEFWTSDYPAMPGAIALGGIFLVTVIEMVFSPSRHVSRGGPTIEMNAQSSSQDIKREDTDIALDTSPGNVQEVSAPTELQPRPHLRDLGPLVGRSSSMSRAITRMGEEPDRVSEVAVTSVCGDEQPNDERKDESVEVDRERNGDGFGLTPEQKRKKEVMQVFMLEMGILFHSVFIGMSLSVTVGSEFVVLLIAIVFHQTFEGLALGSRIASLEWPKNAVQPWLMSLAYGCTTPIGQGIGLATHTLYSPESETGLLLVGTMNAISAGLLIFASLVELMSEDFLSDESWRVLRGRKRVIACILVFLGAFFMSLVGAWA